MCRTFVLEKPRFNVRVLKDLVSSMTIDRRWKNSPKSTKFTQRQNYLCLLCLFVAFHALYQMESASGNDRPNRLN